MKQVTGGVCAAQGFSAAGIHCGIRKNQAKRDLALIYSAVPASAAAVYTTNLVKGAPLTVTKAHLADGKAQAIICNSGNANTCNADGIAVAEEMSALTAAALHIAPQDVIVASTGVIGQPLDLAPIRTGLPQLAAALGDHSDQAAEGIMTTDTQPKEIAVQFTAGGKTCTIGGIAKGSGMIHPNLATMLVFLTTDCAVSAPMLHAALTGDVSDTFNMVSVDGDTSTNDMVAVLANGLAGNTEITAPGADFTAFCRALNSVTVWLCRQDRGRRRGRDAPDRVLRHRRGRSRDGENRGQEHRLLVARQGRHVRRGRQLGPRAVRHRLQRHACGRAQGRRVLPLGSRNGVRVRRRRGHPVFRGGSQTDPARKGDRDPRGPQVRRRGRDGLGLRPDI